MQLVAGQRWISETEPDLGLGTFVDGTDRIIRIRFTSSNCIRQYTRREAPLKRIIFKLGDQLQLKDNTCLTVENLTESGGLIYYSEKNRSVCEADLSDTISFSLPQDRLFAGVTDSNKLFDLRYTVLRNKAVYDASAAKGFIGGQVELIPHQLFIADAVTKRHIPRVLLSDETGLGKTIEASLILHKLLLTHRVGRVLIIVPESLVHQWFIELYRKFNLSFMVMNEDYCSSLTQENPGINPFVEHQLCITSLDVLQNKTPQTHILEAGWDMIVIDEAHHVTDNKTIYDFTKTIVRSTQGLLLLTATPEQMGVKNHFLHLQLLDPERYFDFDHYRSEANQYKETIKTVNDLIKKEEPVDHILDTYGPGRVIFRNKRHTVKGFPQRRVLLKPLLATPSQIQAINQEFFNKQKNRAYDFTDDPRIGPLVALLQQKKKVLVICSTKEKVAAITRAVARQISIDIAKFDETMTLLQRDRHAAWFAREDGASALICSEIGSEGRNFQFVHHLFLFDLPQNPELLEQRIGRIDRIGQKERIRIHVPFVQGSGYEILARWYMSGLNLFQKNIDGSHLIYKKFAPDLQDHFQQIPKKQSIDLSQLNALISNTAAYCGQVAERLSQGKNILLEMNSFKAKPARKIIDQINRTDSDTTLDRLLIQILDHYGIDIDFIDKTIFTLNSTQMTDEKFPALTRLSNRMTFIRKTAIIRDDVDFFSWDHPFVQQTVDFFLINGTGACTTGRLNGEAQPGILLETIFLVECIAPMDLNLERFLIPDPIRIVVDHTGKDMTDIYDFEVLSANLVPDHKNWFKDMDQIKQVLIPSLIDKSKTIAQTQSLKMIRQGHARIKTTLGKEVTRLKELKKINPDIKKEEILLAQARMDALSDHLASARIRMDALRLIRVQ